MDTALAPLNERPSPLLSVPTEIIEIIATFADDEYPEERPLFKPRLNCRQLRDQLDPEFAQRYLSEPFIAISRSSLEALIYICQHPIFGHKVRKVRLLAYADLDRVAETLAKKAGYGLLEPDKLPTAHQPLEERVKEAVENFTGENLHLRTSDEATKLLRTAFNVLSDYISEFTVGICGALGLAEKISELKLVTTEYPDISPEVYHATESSETTEAILSSLCSGSLRQIHLSRLVCKSEYPKEFLLKHQQTLEKVSFNSLVLIGAWAEVLEWIRDNLSLHMFSFSDPCYMDQGEFEGDDPDKTVQYWSDNGSWDSPDDIRVGLNQLLEIKREADEERDH
ncbi:hypothetical protein KCU64_g6273, partial [Aureobasidium melanogenum]